MFWWIPERTETTVWRAIWVQDAWDCGSGLRQEKEEGSWTNEGCWGSIGRHFGTQVEKPGPQRFSQQVATESFYIGETPAAQPTPARELEGTGREAAATPPADADNGQAAGKACHDSNSGQAAGDACHDANIGGI